MRQQFPQIRQRNNRGQYQSIEHTRQTNKEQQIIEAELRLRVIERISKYREEKLRKEFVKLEEELKKEEDKIKSEKDKERKRRHHMDNQRKIIEKFQ